MAVWQALTATATEKVRKDICSSLLLKQPVVVSSSIDRPNIHLTVIHGEALGDDEFELQDLYDFITGHPGEW